MSTDKRLSSIQPYPYSALKKGRKNLESDLGVHPPKKIEFLDWIWVGNPESIKIPKFKPKKNPNL